MLKKRRLFIGLSVNGWLPKIEAVQQQLKNILKKFPGDIQWQQPEAVHLTLVFIGEVDDISSLKKFMIQ